MLSAGKILGVAVLALLFAGSARANTIGYTVYFIADDILIQNDSDLYGITAVSITIGDTAYNYDTASGSFGVTAGSFVLLEPDTVDGAVRSDLLSFTFTGFDPGERFGSANDIDPDSDDSVCCNTSGVLFNNGNAPNAEISVTFSNTLLLGSEMNDTSAEPDPDGLLCQETYECSSSASFELSEPELLLLIGVSAAALAAFRRRSA
jgi:hypothetical protein